MQGPLWPQSTDLCAILQLDVLSLHDWQLLCAGSLLATSLSWKLGLLLGHACCVVLSSRNKGKELQGFLAASARKW
jgi:hypothetical protein